MPLPRPTALLAVAVAVAGVLAAANAAGAPDAGARFTRFAGFALGTDTLAGIRERLGPAPLVETGDAGDYAASLCYAIGTRVVTFVSTELGSASHRLLGVALGETPARGPCGTWPARVAVPAPALGRLRLGMTRSQFAAAATAPVAWTGPQATLTFPLPVSGPGGAAADPGDAAGVRLTLVADFNHGRLAELHAWRSAAP